MTSLKGVAVVVASLFALNAHAEGWGDKLKGIKDKLDAATAQEGKQVKPNVPTAVPAEAQAANTGTTSSAASEVPVVNAAFDIKGIQLGMSVKEVQALARKELSPSDSQAQCNLLQIPVGHEWYLMGDQVVVCRGYEYFGQIVDNMKGFFIRGKLSFLIIGTFSSETDADHDYPAVSAALAEKYRAQPSLDYGNNRFSDDHNFVMAMKDAAGNELATSGHRRPYMSGISYKNVSVYLQAKDYEQIQAARETEQQAAEVRAQQDEHHRKQRDL